MHVTRVPPPCARVCVCVCVDQGRLLETRRNAEWCFARLPLDFRIYHPFSLSLSLSRVLSSLPHRDLWNVSNRTNPFSSS